MFVVADFARSSAEELPGRSGLPGSVLANIEWPGDRHLFVIEHSALISRQLKDCLESV